MTVIAFRPRPGSESSSPAEGVEGQTAITGTFRSPRGGLGTMHGHLRLQRMVIAPRGAFVRGVFTGELLEPDGTPVGVDSRRCVVPADLTRCDGVLRAVVRPMQLDLMGIMVHVDAFVVSADMAFAPPARPRRTRRQATSGGVNEQPS